MTLISHFVGPASRKTSKQISATCGVIQANTSPRTTKRPKLYSSDAHVPAWCSDRLLVPCGFIAITMS